METGEQLKHASCRFEEYLQSHRQRKTPERFAILEAVYSFSGHFTLEELLKRMIEERHFIVSRATVYNTINILTDAGVVVRHRLGGTAEYEKAVGMADSHFHLICSKCGAMKEFHDEKLLRSLSEIRVGKFTVDSYTLYVHGICAKCASVMKRKKKRLLK